VDHSDDRDALAERFLRVRTGTEALALPLSAEDQQLQSMPDASPTKWHRAHTSWFFEEFLLGPAGVPPIDEHYRYLFNSYYDAVGPRHARPRRGILSRPCADEITAYRRAVDGRMVELLRGLDEGRLEEIRPLVALGLAHEEQHQELILTDILHAFSESPLLPAVRPAGERPELGPESSPPLAFVEFAGGVVEIGAPPAAGFRFDNEGPRHRVFLEPFAIASRPISVAEVRAFIEAGGYRRSALWLSEGYEHARRQDREAPACLRLDGGRALMFGVDGEREALDDEPACHLSYYEADAVARFLGGRLPTEHEWEHVAARSDPSRGNFRESGALRPRPACDGDVAVRQLFGDVWEWTASAYAAYPGFRPATGAVGEYNGKFMVNQMVLRGGSCFTPRGHVRVSYRNFWHPGTFFQMTGARMARSLDS
jgi:ergothioneine biosynthesis protein EgtB